MAKKRKRKQQVEQPPAPDHLILELHAPGMSPLHRAGLGGLACTLKYIEQAYRDGLLDEDQVPGGPWPEGKPPWEIEPGRVTLHFGKPEGAGEFMERLFSIAFDIKEGVIYLPGQYPYRSEPPLPVRAKIQEGITKTFLQGTQGVKWSDSNSQILMYYPEEGNPEVAVPLEHRQLKTYRHQVKWIREKSRFWKRLAPEGTLTNERIEITSLVYPGAMERHQAFGRTKLKEPPDRFLAAVFALVGTIAIPIESPPGASPVPQAILIMPDIADIKHFIEVYPHMTPSTLSECQIASGGELALTTYLRLRAYEFDILPRFYILLFQYKIWMGKRNKNQLPRSKIWMCNPLSTEQLKIYAIASAELPNFISRRSTEKYYSPVKALISDNLSKTHETPSELRWYSNFTALCRQLSSNNSRNKISLLIHRLEREGLFAMVNNDQCWKEEAEQSLVKAIHHALRQRYEEINRVTGDPNSDVAKKRKENEYLRWYLTFVGAKTREQIRFAIFRLFGRTGENRELQYRWRSIIPFVEEKWQLARDLALLALASFKERKQSPSDKNHPSKST